MFWLPVFRFSNCLCLCFRCFRSLIDQTAYYTTKSTLAILGSGQNRLSLTYAGVDRRRYSSYVITTVFDDLAGKLVLI